MILTQIILSLINTKSLKIDTMYCLKNATNCKEQTHSLKKNLEKASFSVDSIPKDAIPFYTGFPNKQVFEDVFKSR